MTTDTTTEAEPDNLVVLADELMVIKKAPKPQRRMIAGEIQLTNSEILELADELAQKHDELVDAEVRRKNIVDQRKSEEAEIKARINTLVRKVSSKVDSREFFCEAELDFNLKVKRWIDVKTGDIRKVEDLTAYDYQQQIRFEEENDANNTEDSSTGYKPEDDEDFNIQGDPDPDPEDLPDAAEE